MNDLKSNEQSMTKDYLSMQIAPKEAVRSHGQTPITIKGASHNNLNDVDVNIPIGILVSIAGVSGSGKSSLIFDVLDEQAENVDGLEQFEEIISVSQSTITKMKRSNVATYTNVFKDIRNVFARQDESRSQGLTAKHFSFNTNGGRCETCEGLGYVMSNMLFFNDMEVVCPTCRGKRFKDNILNVHYKNYNIDDVLESSVEEALTVFEDEPKITKILQLLTEIGLDYLKLGQSLTTISGGEGQRLKMSLSLMKKNKQKSLFLLDEPSAGLHPYDIKYLLELFNRLIDKGNSIIMVEHNIQMINYSDWIIELGPEGGVKGGYIISQGSPLKVKENPESVTGSYL